MLPPVESQLVIAQRKATLITKYCKAALNNKTPPWVFQFFAEQIQSIETFWILPERIPAFLADSKNAIKRQAVQAKKNAWKLQRSFCNRSTKRRTEKYTFRE